MNTPSQILKKKIKAAHDLLASTPISEDAQARITAASVRLDTAMSNYRDGIVDARTLGQVVHACEVILVTENPYAQ